MKTSLFGFWLILIHIASAHGQSQYEIVSKDSVNSRVFVKLNLDKDISDNEFNKTLTHTIRNMKSDNRFDFRNKYLKISFFYRKELAIYKPERDYDLYLKWRKSYKGEFSNKDSILITYPMIAKRRKKLKIY